MKRWRAAASILAMAVVTGCANGKSDATRQAAACEQLRAGKDYGAAVAACRGEVEQGCVAFGESSAFCGTAHMHLGMALLAAGDMTDTRTSGPEFRTAERILCKAGKSGDGPCAVAQAMSQKYAIGIPES